MAVSNVSQLGFSGKGKERSLLRASAFTSFFSPSLLSPELWLDASDTSTITESSGDVSQWNNKGSLGNFAQATGAVQPKTGVTTLNGRNVIDFNADYLVAANTNEWKFLHDGTKYIVAIVAKAGTGSNPATDYVLMGNTGASSSGTGMILFYSDTPSNNRLAYWVTRGVGASFVVQTQDADKWTPNAFNIQTHLLDPSNGTAANRHEYFFDGGGGTKSNTATNAVSSSNPGQALEIGRDAFAAFVGSIAEIVIVSGANATETNRVALRNYLNDKWAVY